MSSLVTLFLYRALRRLVGSVGLKERVDPGAEVLGTLRRAIGRVFAIDVGDVTGPIAKQSAELAGGETLALAKPQAPAPALVKEQVVLSLRAGGVRAKGSIDRVVA